MITRILSFLIVSAICIGLIGCNNTQEPTVEVTTANAITTENQGHSDWVYFKECPTLPEPSSIVDLLFIGESCVTYTSSDGDWKIHTYSYGKKQPSDAMDLILERYLHTIQELDFRVVETKDGSEVSYASTKIAVITASNDNLLCQVYGGNEDLLETHDAGNELSEASPSTEKYCVDGESCLILDQDGIKIWLAGTYERKPHQIEANIIVENSNDYDVELYYNGKANGWVICSDDFWKLPNCYANSKLKTSIIIQDELTDFTEVEALKTLELIFTGRTVDSISTTIFEENTGVIHIHANA